MFRSSEIEFWTIYSISVKHKLLAAETRASRLENELQISHSSNKQRVEDNAKWENECEKLRGVSKENERNIVRLEREIAEQSGKLEAMKVSLEYLVVLRCQS